MGQLYGKLNILNSLYQYLSTINYITDQAEQQLQPPPRRSDPRRTSPVSASHRPVSASPVFAAALPPGPGLHGQWLSLSDTFWCSTLGGLESNKCLYRRAESCRILADLVLSKVVEGIFVIELDKHRLTSEPVAKMPQLQPLFASSQSLHVFLWFVVATHLFKRENTADHRPKISHVNGFKML